MPVYPMATVSNRTDPPPEPEKTALDWMDECAHCRACQRLYLRHIDARELVGWEDEMAAILGCQDCEEWES